MAATRHAQPRKYGIAEKPMKKRRVSSGRKYTLAAARRKLAVRASDCAKKKFEVSSAVWKPRGKNGNTPPHVPVAFTAKNSAKPSDATFGLSHDIVPISFFMSAIIPSVS